MAQPVQKPGLIFQLAFSLVPEKKWGVGSTYLPLDLISFLHILKTSKNMSHSFSYWICQSLAGVLCYLLVQTQEQWGLLTLQLERVPWNPSLGQSQRPKGRTSPPRRKTPSLAEPTPSGWRQLLCSCRNRHFWSVCQVQVELGIQSCTEKNKHSSLLPTLCSCPLSDWIKLCLHSFSLQGEILSLPWVPLSFTIDSAPGN